LFRLRRRILRIFRWVIFFVPFSFAGSVPGLTPA
jgi:hypothetical protein